MRNSTFDNSADALTIHADNFFLGGKKRDGESKRVGVKNNKEEEERSRKSERGKGAEPPAPPQKYKPRPKDTNTKPRENTPPPKKRPYLCLDRFVEIKPPPTVILPLQPPQPLPPPRLIPIHFLHCLVPKRIVHIRV